LKYHHTIPRLIKNLLCLSLAFIFLIPAINSQERKSLESKRKKLIQDIRLTTKLLRKTSRTRATALDRFITLKKQIEAREELITTLEKEVDYVTNNIDRTQNVVIALQQDIKNLEQEYGAMARSAYRQKTNRSNLLFLFSSGSFNQAFRRWQYLKQYDQNRKRTAALILSTKKTLDSKLTHLEESKVEKETLLEEATVQQTLLHDELDDKNQLLTSLQKDESRLQKELANHRANHKKLNNAIENIIVRQMATKRKKERSRSALAEANIKRNKTTRKSVPTPNRSSKRSAVPTRNLSTDFSNNKGRLPWPVRKGVVSKYFGKQPHPSLKKIEITNNGIDILTDRKATIRAVFEGEVVGLQFIPGHNNMLILKHGDYYTVYSNLDDVQVKKGAYVSTQQPLGRASVNPKTQQSEVHFEVWKNKKRMNPMSWVERR